MWTAIQKKRWQHNEVLATQLPTGDPKMTGTSIKSILAFALLVGVASQANADIWGHIDRQANDIERATKLLRQEVDHYRHTRYFGQLIGATARLKGQAIRVHSIADHSQCPKALKYAVRDMERAFHDAEMYFDRAERGAAYGDGHVSGHTAHVKRLLNRIGDCIHNLQDDLVTLGRGHARNRVNTYRPPVAVPVPRHDVDLRRNVDLYRGYGGYNRSVARPTINVGRSLDHYAYDLNGGRGCRSGRGGSGFGFSIGGGSSRITFNF